ncbi:hypothetical protein GOP47_0014016 [Adiantum capillus-veneris]|uniref:Uncharacterized protein n=1 Tax=Adiantum capillus-veneris TaxID=13818 RepID=A0A9D4UPX0_ADICA|nr:hypothetical protein GOP47_0014016 [Adiantum capillus-veneris]
MPKLAADGAADMQLFRSVSARQSQGSSSYGALWEKRRSTSFDDTHGEVAGACTASCAQDADIGISKKKTSFWRSRVWIFSKGKKGTLPAISEKEEGRSSKWKKLLHKLRSKAKEARKPAICSSTLDLQVANCDRSGFLTGEGRSKSNVNQPEKQQRLDTVYPEPTLVRQRSTAAIPIWERRSAACPPSLDLNNLRITGLRHVSRPHQARG